MASYRKTDMKAFVCELPAHDSGRLAGSTTNSVSHLTCMHVQCVAVVGLQQGGIGSTAFHIQYVHVEW